MYQNGVIKVDRDTIRIASILLIDLAECLSTEDCEITTDDLLENMSGRAISSEDAGSIMQWIAE